MAEEGKTNYPMMPVKHWWALRNKFKQSIPGTVTENYLATSLNMELKSARANILPFLQQMGITDIEGKTLDRAKQWRDDIEYPTVCAQILEDCYPVDLRDAVPTQKTIGKPLGAGLPTIRGEDNHLLLEWSQCM